MALAASLFCAPYILQYSQYWSIRIPSFPSYVYRREVASAFFRTFLMGVLGDFDVGVLDESPWPAFAKSIFVLLMSAGALERNMERGDATLPQASSQLLTFHFHLRF